MTRCTRSFYVVLFMCVVVFSGCGKVEDFGEPITVTDIVSINSLLQDPGAYGEKEIVIEGKIILECPTGCWFDLEQDGKTMHVELGSSGFAIPQKVGSNVKVSGELKERGGKTILIGKGVEIE